MSKRKKNEVNFLMETKRFNDNDQKILGNQEEL